jgi:hypothetical protein
VLARWRVYQQNITVRTPLLGYLVRVGHRRGESRNCGGGLTGWLRHGGSPDHRVLALLQNTHLPLLYTIAVAVQARQSCFLWELPHERVGKRAEVKKQLLRATAPAVHCPPATNRRTECGFSREIISVSMHLADGVLSPRWEERKILCAARSRSERARFLPRLLALLSESAFRSALHRK